MRILTLAISSILIKKVRRVEEPTLMSPSSSARSPMLLRITEMTSSSRSHLTVETMLSISVPSIWVPHRVNQPESFSIPDRSTWQSPVFFATMRPLATTSSRNTTHSQAVSFKGIKLTRGVRQWLTTCTSLTPTRSCQRPPRSLPMDLPSSRVSYGRTTLASNL